MLRHWYRNDFILALDKPTKVELDRRLCQGVPDCKETLSKVSNLASRVILSEGLNILHAASLRPTISHLFISSTGTAHASTGSPKFPPKMLKGLKVLYIPAPTDSFGKLSVFSETAKRFNPVERTCKLISKCL